MGYMSEYIKLRKTFALLYVTAITKPIPDIALGQDDYYIIHDLLRGVNSPKFDQISFVVSGEAKNAGTIMVLSGDDILMTESGSLGAIDAQVKIGRFVVSAHDYIEWTEQERQEAVKLGKLNPFDATIIAQIIIP